MEQKRVAIFGASVRGLAGMAIQYFHNRKSKLNGAVKQEDKPEKLAEDADNVSDNDDLM